MPSRLVLLPVLALAALSRPVAAQEEDPFARCAAMADDVQRLACFDATYARNRAEVAEAQERAAERAREEFGFRPSEDTSRAKEEAAVTATVAEVLTDSRRNNVIVLSNGQLWREINGSTMRNRVRDGWVATITRHWSGAYEMRFDGRSGYLRVSRVR
ncbi:hypothetical protein [Aurantiacibacter spongiae]|uniref:SH3 domain-containing protein n=1 Tax=Aurantiacibacter spongiae TaxID=2488860 RepID=A0A3N5DIV8_9SPHN|nr:hypothetical protein [Aurantiacibacter spongiae]RPF71592.1 hypothetical protein EG799_08130 [Aurantiacibacter spongiae]